MGMESKDKGDQTMKPQPCPKCKKLNFIADFCRNCGEFIYDSHNADWDENEVGDWWKKGKENKGRWESELNQSDNDEELNV